MEDSATTLNTANARIAFHFHARDLILAMGQQQQEPIRFRVLLDRRPPGTAHGTDADGHGNGTVSEPRLYQLIRQHGHLADRSFEITFLAPVIRAYAFTFRLDHGALPCHPCRLVPVRQVNADLLGVRYVEPGTADGQRVILHRFPGPRRAFGERHRSPRQARDEMRSPESIR